MEDDRFCVPAMGTMALRLITALGLMTTVGCGSSADNSHKDAGFDLLSGKALDLGSFEAQAKTDAPQSSVEVQLAEVSIDVNLVQVDLGIDAPAEAIDTPLNPDLPIDRPITMDDTGTDVTVPGGEVGNSTEVGKIPGGTGGISATGGATGMSGSGGQGGAGGTGAGASPITGWPNTSTDSPHAFGPPACNGGAQPDPATYTFTLKNSGATVVTFTGVSFSGATGYMVDLTAGTSKIQPGESKVVTITPPGIPFPLTPPAAYSGVLTLTTDEATDNVHTIHLTEVVHGAKLAWGTGAISTYLGGAAPGSAPLFQDFTVLNTGDQAATVDITSSDPNFTISPPGTGVEIPAGGSVVRTLAITPPAIQGVYTTAIGLLPSVTSNLCAAPPAQWTAYAMSIAGYPRFDPPGGTFPFSGACGIDKLDSQTIKIANVGTGVLKWLPVIVSTQGQPICFVVNPNPPADPDNPASWPSLDVGVEATITVTPTMLAANASEQCAKQQLVVQFSSADADGTYTYKTGDPVYNNSYNLSVTPLGDNLVISPNALDFGYDDLLKSPPSITAPTRTLTFSNRGWTDPLGSATTATVILSIVPSNTAEKAPPPYAFDINGTAQKTITLPSSPDGQPVLPGTEVTIYYLRPQIGPYTGTRDDWEVEWRLDAMDRSCMCQPTCPTRSGTVSLRGQVVEGQVSSQFTDPEHGDDFGTVFCGAKANGRDYILTNNGDGPLTINSAVFASDAYFSLTTSQPLTTPVERHGTITFHIAPKTIPGADITGASDLGPLSDKFSTTLTISTDARNPNASNTPTVITVPLKMHAQGIIIDPVAPTTWSYQQILWPASMNSSFTVWVTNRGNVKGVSNLVPALPSSGQSPFSMAQTSVDENGVLTALSSKFGGDIFNDCNTATAAYNAPGQLSVVADLSGAQRQDLGSSAGVCQAVNGPWVQDVTLTGQVGRTGSMCSTGQRCVPHNPPPPDNPNDAGSCLCDNSLASCGLIGCCTTIGVNGICVPYANQTPVRDTTGQYPGLTGCGEAGKECSQCADAESATCNAGVCSCTANAQYCGENDQRCINTSTDVDNCGGCSSELSFTACAMNHITRACHGGDCDGTCNTGWDNCDQPQTKRQNGCNVHLTDDESHCGACRHACAAGQTCSDGQCSCSATSCPDGCCTSQGACIPFGNGQGFDVCGSGGQLCAACVNQQECVTVAHGGKCMCNANTCPDGCCQGANGLCMNGTSNRYCGTSGASCVDCTTLSSTPVCTNNACGP